LRLQVGGDLYFAALQRNPQMLNGALPDRLGLVAERRERVLAVRSVPKKRIILLRIRGLICTNGSDQFVNTLKIVQKETNRDDWEVLELGRLSLQIFAQH
jgi:hypothetical protein